MANLTPTNKKITELPVATTVAPTDLLIVVQGGTTKQVSQDTVAAAVAGSTQLAATYVALRGVWATGTPYPKNSLVIQAGAVYLAAADVPSRTAFTVGDWQALGGATAVTPAITTTVNGDGFLTLVGTGVTDNGDGFLTLTDSTVTDNGDGYVALAA